MDSLIKNRWAKWEEKQDETVPTATNQIYEFIDDYLKRGHGTANRASSATMCVKRRWYQNQGIEGTPLTPRKIVNFFLGDLTERTLVFFIKEALVGPGKLYSQVDFGEPAGDIEFQGKPITAYKQKTLMTKIGHLNIPGHADGFGKRNSDGKWELIEIKSAADYGFDEFKETGPGDYLKQSHILMMSDYAIDLGVNDVRFFYLKKNTGNLWDRLFPFDIEIANKAGAEFILADGDVEPDKPFQLAEETYYKKPTGRTVAKFPCSYCNYLERCQGPYEKEFKSGKPVFVFKKESQK